MSLDALCELAASCSGSMVVDHISKMPDAVSSLGVGKSTLQKWLSQYRQEMNGQVPKIGNALSTNLGAIFNISNLKRFTLTILLKTISKTESIFHIIRLEDINTAI